MLCWPLLKATEHLARFLYRKEINGHHIAHRPHASQALVCSFVAG